MPKSLKNNLRICLAALTLGLFPLCGHAADDPSMSFTFKREDYRKYGLGLYQVIHASGTINEGTFDRLKVFAADNNIEPGGEIYLNSTTGNRLEGIRLGRLIRSLGLMTHIGDTNPNISGSCVSACAFAYLGGTFRFMNKSATFGVHKFYRSQRDQQEFTLDQASQVAQGMTDFMRDMGTNVSLFRYMSLNTGGDIVLISKDTLKSMGVVNDGVTLASWSLVDNKGIPFLRGNLQNYKGSHSLSFICDRQASTMKGSASMQAADPASLRRLSAEEGLFLGDTRVKIPGTLTENATQVLYDFPITKEIAVRMADSPQLGIYAQPRDIIYFSGFKIQQNLESKEMVKKYVNECFGTEVVKKDDGIRY